MVETLQSIKEKEHRAPLALSSDRGTEFSSTETQKYLEDNDIKSFLLVDSNIKASVAERFIL